MVKKKKSTVAESTNVKKKKVLKTTSSKPVQTKVKKEKEVVEDETFMATIGRLSFKNAVDLVSEALPSKEYPDAKSGIFIETKNVDGEPMMFLTANSLNVFIAHGIKLQEEIGEGFVVPNGNALKKIVRGLQSFTNPIDMYFDEEENLLKISCGEEYEGSIQYYESDGFVFPPTIEEIKKNEIITLPVKFIQEALNKVAFSCSTDMTIPELTGVLIEQGKDAVNVIGADGNRLSFLTIRSKVKNPKKVIIGVKYLSLFNNILKVLEVKPSETLTLYLSDDKLYFEIDNTVIGIQVFAGEYPIDGGYDQFVIPESDCEITLTLDKAKFLEKLDLAVMHNNSAMDAITLKIGKNGKCKLSDGVVSNNKFNIDFDTIKTKNTSKEEVELSFTPEYLYAVIKCLDEKEFLLSFQSEQGPALIRLRNEKDENYVHVFSLN